MRLTQLNVQDFRNVSSASLKFEGLRTFFWGQNGQGKSNLLEAIGMLPALRSFRTRDTKTLIRHDCDRAGLFFRVDQPSSHESEITINLSAKGKQLSVDGDPVRTLKEHIGMFPMVVMASDDIQLIRGGPAIRRRFLDEALAAIDKNYFTTLARFKSALKERNHALRMARQNTGLIGSFDKALAPVAMDLMQLRRKYCKQLNTYLVNNYATVSGKRDHAELKYCANLGDVTVDDMLASLIKSRERDIRFATTHIGPHRDELELLLDGRSVRDYGSEGQQRSVTLGLRLAQKQLSKNITGITPVVLADDVIGELDDERRDGFWEAVGNESQVFATGTQLPSGSNWQVYQVKSGKTITGCL